MKALDRFIQRRRILMAARWIRSGSRVLDVGCFDGALFEALGDRLLQGVGLDPLLEREVRGLRWRLVRGRLPGASGLAGPFDAVALLAVLEHVPNHDLAELAAEVRRVLAPGGRVVLTVPDPAVDGVLTLLSRLRLIDGMSLEEHHGFKVARTRDLFEAVGLRLVVHRRFQLGLNNLFVFERPD